MNRTGRVLANVFVERLWRSLKYECVYMNEFAMVPELINELAKWFSFYNEKRAHSLLRDNMTPREAYFDKKASSS